MLDQRTASLNLVCTLPTMQREGQSRRLRAASSGATTNLTSLSFTLRSIALPRKHTLELLLAVSLS